ncbi:MAG: hypothetical protein OXH22_00410 [Chloroflexi bacterium]|nr:hypothetical protein [Chloroflexota bacterium]
MTELPSKMLVINEWLFQDIKGENGQTKRQETGIFLTQFAQGQDKFAVLTGNPWMQKAYELMTYSAPDIRELSKLVRSLIINPSKCVILQPGDAENSAPQDAIDAAPEEDIYLIQTYYASNADLLITTDKGLLEAFKSHQDIEVVHRDTFLDDYLNS